MIAVDDTVRVLEGAFNGFVGRVASVEASTNTAVVSVTIFGRATPVEVPVDSLDPADAPDTPTPSRPIKADPTAILDQE